MAINADLMAKLRRWPTTALLAERWPINVGGTRVGGKILRSEKDACQRILEIRLVNSENLEYEIKITKST